MLLLVWVVLLAPMALGTPLIALREANNCGGCHRPGRAQRPVLDRRCTLDCQGCHVDPAGAGPRNQWGYYYEQDQASMFNFFKPIDPLQDTSRFDVHYDGRLIERQTPDLKRTFPMSSQLSLRVRPVVEYLHLTYQALLLGRIEDSQFRVGHNDPRRVRETYSVMIDNLPLDTYVRAYRGPPMYGLRRPNHSLWIRERIGLDQFATTDAVEAGGTPNVPFIRGSLMKGDPYLPQEDRQVGHSIHGGFRGVTLAWHINGSSWSTQSQKNQIRMQSLGAGLAPWRFVLMAERNWRKVDDLPYTPQSANWQTTAARIWPSSQIDEYTLAFAPTRGVMVGAVGEELKDPDHLSHRRSLFVDLHPLPFIQLEVWRRFEFGTRTLADTLAIAHLYADF